jgi:hypothetical protein
MKGLPQPYNLRPRQQTWLTTPQKKLLFYILAVLSIGFIIYSVTPEREQEVDISLDTEKHFGSGMKRVLDDVGDSSNAV